MPENLHPENLHNVQRDGRKVTPDQRAAMARFQEKLQDLLKNFRFERPDLEKYDLSFTVMWRDSYKGRDA